MPLINGARQPHRMLRKRRTTKVFRSDRSRLKMVPQHPDPKLFNFERFSYRPL